MTNPSANYGVHSEVGTLRKVLVCSPGLAHERLTPTNCDDLLFDDVLWVENARRDHFDFMAKLRDRDVDVVELHDLLAETMGNAEAKDWLLDRNLGDLTLEDANGSTNGLTKARYQRFQRALKEHEAWAGNLRGTFGSETMDFLQVHGLIEAEPLDLDELAAAVAAGSD